MIKNSPIKKPFFYDTKEGIDYFTKLMIEENPKKLSEKEKQDILKEGQAMKKAALDNHVRTVKPMDNLDPNTYLSDPKVRGKILEIDKLEKDLNLAPPKPKKSVNYLSNNYSFAENFKKQSKNIKDYKPKTPLATPPKKRNYWDAYVKLNAGNKGPMKFPELTQEEIERAKRPSDWEVIYGSMSPFEKGQWNNEQRRKKLKDQKEEAEDKAAEEPSSVKMAKEVVEHAIPNSSLIRGPKSKDHYPGALSAEDSISNMPVEHAIRPKNHEPGLSESFVKEKMAEAKIIKDVLGE